MEHIGLKGIITLHEIPEEWAHNKELFDAWWLPETELVNGLWQITRPARISDEAKMQRCVKRVENIVTNTGITQWLNNTSVTGQGNMWAFFEILSVGNVVTPGVTRADTSVLGDGFGTNARKAPTSFSIVGFQTTVVTNYASGDAAGTWTNIGVYGYNSSGNQHANTSTGTGALMTHALFPFVKGATAYAVNYAFLLSN